MIGINPFEGLWGDFCDDTDDFRKLATLVPQYRADAWTEGLQNVGIDDAELGAELGELFPEIRRTKHYVYKDTFPILDTLKKDYHLLLLTNGSPNLQTEKLNGVPKLPPYFDHIVISGGYGRGKPERALFQHALDLLKVNNDETIMVGDKLTTDILGANEAEIPSVWINRTNMAPSKDIVPNYEIESLCELPNIIQSLK